MELLTEFVTHMLVPSETTCCGEVPTVMVSSTAPSLARSLVTVKLELFATQCLFRQRQDPEGLGQLSIFSGA